MTSFYHKFATKDTSTKHKVLVGSTAALSAAFGSVAVVTGLNYFGAMDTGFVKKMSESISQTLGGRPQNVLLGVFITGAILAAAFLVGSLYLHNSKQKELEGEADTTKSTMMSQVEKIQTASNTQIQT